VQVQSLSPQPFKVIMNCIICREKINIVDNVIPPKWFGKYFGDKLVEVICKDCIIKDENKERWNERYIQ
jgi:hypothetical protein